VGAACGRGDELWWGCHATLQPEHTPGPRALRATIHDTFRILILINPDSDHESTLESSRVLILSRISTQLEGCTSRQLRSGTTWQPLTMPVAAAPCPRAFTRAPCAGFSENPRRAWPSSQANAAARGPCPPEQHMDAHARWQRRPQEHRRGRATGPPPHSLRSVHTTLFSSIFRVRCDIR
jgi:hypothetical protein